MVTKSWKLRRSGVGTMASVKSAYAAAATAATNTAAGHSGGEEEEEEAWADAVKCRTSTAMTTFWTTMHAVSP